VTRTTAPSLAFMSLPGVSNETLLLQSADYIVDEPGETSEVLTFIDNSVGDSEALPYSRNVIASADSTDKTSLAKFLSRPTLIDSRTWATSDVNGALGSAIDPWFLFLNNTVIKNKLHNYAFLRAKLCLKVIVNATPFHFGLLRASYEPNVNSANSGDRTSKIRTNPVSPNPYIIPYSQLPGMWIYPASNSGGELYVPFFRHSNWLPLTSAAAAKTMGSLNYYIASPLGIASTSGSTSLTIETFAWMDEIELSGSTSELILQAKDEYVGMVSKPASAVASAMSMLETVPIIGRFARATGIGASAVASIAHIFGYSNTPLVVDVQPFVPMSAPHMATSEISLPYQKLTLDPKQELSIDPTLHGIAPTDELVISQIVSKKSALVVTGWSTSDNVGTVLFNSRVTPNLFGLININDGSSVLKARRVYHTPLSYLAALFASWRGDIIFEFDVLCTKFHKGRLKISWDPVGTSGTVVPAENSVYTTILDVGQNNKASIRVPYHQALAWLKTRGISSDNWTPGSSLSYGEGLDNGLLILSVLTPLMSPVSPQNIGVLVSVRAADNFEFANPRSHLGESDFSSTPHPSFFAVQSADYVCTEPEMIVFGDQGQQHPERYALNFGEAIVSLRALLHRMSLYDVSVSPISSATKAFWFRKSYARLPPMFGYDPNGLSTANKILAASGTAPFNYTPTHPITYVAMLFGSFRGSVNYAINPSVDLYPYVGDVRIQHMTASTFPISRLGNVISFQNAGANISNSARFYNLYPTVGAGGSAITNSQTGGTLLVNSPHMANTNFFYPDPTYSMQGNGADQSNAETVLLEIIFKQSVSSTVSDLASITTHAGTGPDFNCFWLLCCPTLDYYVSNPTAP